LSSLFMEILHIFSVTGNKNRKIWQKMEVGCGENAACGGARAFFDAAGRRGRRPLQGKANCACHPTLQAPQGEGLWLLFSINLLTL
jgi:hypothetical protein